MRAIAADAVVRAEWNYGFGVIHVRPENADRARAILGDSETDVRVLDGIGEGSQSSAVEQVSATLAEAGQESFVASFDLDSTTVVVETYGPAVTDAESLSVRAGLGNENPVKVALREAPKELAPEPTARGGMAYSSCTGGFIVKSGTSRYIATAHHCATKPSTYDGAATGRALGLISGHSPGVTSWFSQISTLSGLGVTVVIG